jgi:thiol-disulfide isomerase/thioredoxin
MKKIISALALAALIAGCTADKTLTVKGDLKNLGDTLIVMNQNDRESRDTVLVQDGKFEFTLNVDTVSTYFIIEPQCFRGEQGASLQFVAVPGETLELTGDVNERFDYNGSQFYQGYHEVDLMLEEAQKPAKEIQNNCMKMMEQGVPQDSVMKIYEAAINPIQQEMENKVMDFIKTHPDLEAVATLIPELKPEKMAEAVALLSEKVKNGRMKPYYQAVIDRMEAQKKAEEESAAKQAEGVEAPDFTLNDINGQPLTLSSLRGKYVILDFWGSWCGWCIKGFPEMKNYYKKYAGKFEILGIDCNDTEDKWKNAVKENELPWLHVYCPNESTVKEDFGIQGYPTKIILSPEGKIVKTIVGEDPAFYELLDSLFGKK